MLRRDLISILTFVIILFLLGTTNAASEDGDDRQETIEPLSSVEARAEANDAPSRYGIDQLTNRRKVLAKDADLGSVADEDVVVPREEPRLVVMAAGASVREDEGGQEGTGTAADLVQAESGSISTSGCEPVIGVSYRDSTPCTAEVAQPPKGAPNVVFIVLDDVGFGQIGCFGGPIDTPNIDRLADGGIRYNNFHTTAMCSPTRACLLTGRNHHSVGIGAVIELPAGYPGYSMTLSKSAATLPEILLENGFNTFAVGKWHLSEDLNAAGPFDNWPTGRGFEKYYGFIGSETNQWYPDLVIGTTRVDPPKTPEEGYHISEDLVDQAIGFINSQQAAEPDNPYFLYLSFGACHAPHHAPQEYINMYKGRFDQGWDEVRNETLARQKAGGVVPEYTELPPRNPDIPAWEELSDDEQRIFAREQEVYAGFLTHTDDQIGRFLDHLEEMGELNDTMIVLISDNGASREGGFNGTSNNYLYFNRISENLTSILAHIDELGGTTTWNHYAEGWAMAGNTPFKRYKQNTHEGGIHDPMIIYYPALIEDGGGIREQYTHAIDIVPTVLEVLGLSAPEVYNGRPQKPIEGVSFAATLVDPEAETGKYIQYYEMVGNRALWYNGWKATAYHPPESGGDFTNDTWELYNTDEDFSEVRDLASEYPQKLQEMIDLWFNEAGKYQVLPLDDRQKARFQPAPKTGVFTYYPGSEKIVEPELPDTLNHSYKITAYVDIPEAGAEGVLFSIGGRFGGLSLFVMDGHLVYDYNFVGMRHYTLSSTSEVPVGPSVLTMAFDLTGSHRGISTLYIDGQEEGSAEVVTQPSRYSFEEGLEIGKDPQTPVSERYESPFAFKGTLEKVVLEVEG